MQQQHPSCNELVKAVDSAILDRQTMFITTEQGTACVLPMEDYIRLVEMKTTLANVVRHVQRRDMEGVLMSVELFSKWLLEGGGESYTLEEV